MTHGSLFSGIGGFDLAAEWMGWENKFHCEWNPFGQKVLKHYWPNAESFDDITKTDFKKYNGTIDIISGGFPCQPYSQAGKRLGKDDNRHLWPQMCRAIREVQPSWIVGENVAGLLNWNGGLVLDEIKADLEAEGFEVFPPCVLPACGVDAPHKRDRAWFIAYSSSNGHQLRRFEENRFAKIESKSLQNKRERIWNNNWRVSKPGVITNTVIQQLQGGEQLGSIRSQGEIEGQGRQFSGSVCGKWANFPTQPPICGRDDGISSQLAGITFSKHRTESIKGYGNAIVPQVAHQIFKAIEQYKNLPK